MLQDSIILCMSFQIGMIFQIGQNIRLGNDKGSTRGKYQDLFSSLGYFIISEELPGFSLVLRAQNVMLLHFPICFRRS